MERRADRTLGFALWAKHVKNTALCALALAALNQLVISLVNSISADKVEALTDEQRVELKKKLLEVREKLAGLLNMNAMCHLSRSWMFRGSVRGLESSTEDIADIIEDLVLSENKEFRSLLSDCVEKVNSKQAAGELARM